MQSLRTRRPSSKPQVQPAKTRPVARNKSAVNDKIKKRMSMRYVDISGPTALNLPPTVPELPSSTRSKEQEQDEAAQDLSVQVQLDPRAANNAALETDDFDPDAFLKTKLASSTESEIKSLQSELRFSKDDTASELQRNVFKNYAEFVNISKEISNLENEMLELKESLVEWKNMPSLLHIDDSASVADRRRNARSSVADLRVIYANQMQTLHSHVEGSAKFVPAIPGRHVVSEMDGILALNAATYKVERTVRLITLDDSVLVARRRRKNTVAASKAHTEGGKWVAERYWPLNEMMVLDTKDTPSMTNVFKVRHNKETHVYRTDSPADKKAVLSLFRQVAEEWAGKRRKEREGEHERRKSIWTHGGDHRNSSYRDKMPAIPDWMAELSQRAPEEGSSKEKGERDAQWVSEFADQLTVAIALREWDEAVALVEQGREKLPTTPMLTAKLTPLNASLASALLQSLSSPSNRKSTVISLISLLVRLNAGAAARTTFLAARTEAMRRYIRAIRFDGNISMYISDLSMVVFSGIKHSADWFLASFRGNEVASCFVGWAKNQIENFAEIFRTQVYGSDVDSNAVNEALHITYNQSKKLLQDFGLDFRFMLDELLKENPTTRFPSQVTFNAEDISVRRSSDSATTSAAPAAPEITSPPTTLPRSRSPSTQPHNASVPPLRPEQDFLSLQPAPPPRRPRTPVATRSAVTDDSSPPHPVSNPAPPPRSGNRPASNRPPPLTVRLDGMI